MSKVLVNTLEKYSGSYLNFNSNVLGATNATIDWNGTIDLSKTVTLTMANDTTKALDVVQGTTEFCDDVKFLTATGGATNATITNEGAISAVSLTTTGNVAASGTVSAGGVTLAGPRVVTAMSGNLDLTTAGVISGVTVDTTLGANTGTTNGISAVAVDGSNSRQLNFSLGSLISDTNYIPIFSGFPCTVSDKTSSTFNVEILHPSATNTVSGAMSNVYFSLIIIDF